MVHNNMLFNDVGQGRSWTGETDIEALDMNPDYLFLRAGLAGQYNTSYTSYARRVDLLQDYSRSFFFLKPGFLLVFDRFELTHADHTSRWLLHFAREPQVSGDDLGTGSGVTYYGSKSDRFDLNVSYRRYQNVTGVTMESQGRRSHYRPLFPTAGYQVRKIDGGGEPTVADHALIEPWWLDLELPTGQARRQVLAAISLQDAGAGAMLATELVEGSDGGAVNMVGARIDGSWLVLFGKEPSALDATRYTVSGATVEHLLGDMVPGASYTVSGPGAPGSVQASDQGLLRFSTTGSGEVIVGR